MIYAHAGHWLVNLLYVAPLVIVVGAILRDRRKHRFDDDADADPDPGGRG